MTTSLSEIMSDPATARLLSGLDLLFEDFDTKRSAIFIVIPDDNDSKNAIASLCISQLYSYLIETARKSNDKKLHHTTHLILEEFGNLHIPDSPSIASACLSRGIRTYFVIQSKNQLSKYPDGDVILSNALNIMFFHSTESSLLDYISQRMGRIQNGEPLISTAALERLPRDRCLFLCGSERLFPKVVPIRYTFMYFTPSGPPEYPELSPTKRSILILDDICSAIELKSSIDLSDQITISDDHDSVFFQPTDFFDDSAIEYLKDCFFIVDVDPPISESCPVSQFRQIVIGMMLENSVYRYGDITDEILHDFKYTALMKIVLKFGGNRDQCVQFMSQVDNSLEKDDRVQDLIDSLVEMLTYLDPSDVRSIYDSLKN